MSKSTLSTLKSEINMELKAVYSAESDAKSLANSLFSAMNDRVGSSARESIDCIGKKFSYNMDAGYKSANRMVSALERGYAKIDASLGQAEAIMKQARDIIRELGEI